MAQPKPSIRLTKRSVDAAEPAATRYELWDADLKGFGLRVEPTGLKTFILRYRTGEGGRDAAKRYVRIGRYGQMTPEEARTEAREKLKSVARGEDPGRAKADRRQAATVEDLAEAFLTQHVEVKRKPATAASYRQVLNSHVLPHLGARKAIDVSLNDIDALHVRLRDRPFMANRTLAVLSSMFNWGALRKHVPTGFNPVVGAERFDEEGRERFLTIDELERLGAALVEAETDGIPWMPDPDKATSKHAPRPDSRRIVLDPTAVAAIRLLLFTGCRLREVLHLRWGEVDVQRGLLQLPDSKTGKKAVILNAPALAVLASLSRLGTYVVPGDDLERPRHDLKRPWQTVSARAGLEGVRLHDLRHTHASYGAAGGLGLPIIGKLLGHKQSSTTAKYAHIADDPLRRASDAIGNAISTALSGQTSAEVIPHPKRRA